MQLARQKYFEELPFPKTYRVGKYSAYGPGQKQREVLVDLRGHGVLHRLWTTHHPGHSVQFFIYVDDRLEPVLQGLPEDIAQAASRLRLPDIPLGGFQDGLSSSLYLPIRFEKVLRIETEPIAEIADGPYWQIDYALDSDELWPPIQQHGAGSELSLSYNLPTANSTTSPSFSEIGEEFELTHCEPHFLRLNGPGVIRKIEITSPVLDKLLLRSAFDEALTNDDRVDGPFQVDAPLQYLVGNFSNAGVERVENTAVIHFPMPFQKAAVLRLEAALETDTFHQNYPVKLRIEFESNPANIEKMYYFHACYRGETTTGYNDFECCSTSGRGHFVGVHIFDTGHDHGGGDNILFDSGADSAGQLHGICGEDYFHMAYMRVGNRTPYSGCPTHSGRYRHHLEMPIPFEESFVFNWGSFAGQPAKAVAFWYQEKPSVNEKTQELSWEISGPFPLEYLKSITPVTPLPEVATLFADTPQQPRQTWSQTSQRGFVDLCHIHRRYIWPVAPSLGFLVSDICTVAQTSLWVSQEQQAELRVGCDDAIRVFLNDDLIFEDEGRNSADPFQSFRINVTLQEGINRFMVVVGNTENTNWNWNGFSFRLKLSAPENKVLFFTGSNQGVLPTQ